MKKNKAFPNAQFKSQKEYFNFSDLHHVYGREAYDLKKEQDKKDKLLIPKIKEK